MSKKTLNKKTASVLIIVEDDDFVRKAICDELTEILVNLSIDKLVSFSSAEETLSYVQNNKTENFYAVITDYMLGNGMSGVSLLTELNRMLAANEIQLGKRFVMSGYLAPDRIDLLSASSAIDGVFHKPFNIKQAICNTLLSKKTA